MSFSAFGEDYSAQSENSGTQNVPTEFGEFLNSLPDELQNDWKEELDRLQSSQDSETVGNTVKKMADFSVILQKISEIFGVEIGGCLKILATVTGILILSGIMENVKEGLGASGVTKALGWCCKLAVIGGLSALCYESIKGVAGYFSSLHRLVQGWIPLMGTLYCMGGNFTAAAASCTGLTVYLSVLEFAVGRTILPFCGISLAFSLVMAAEPGIRLGGLLSAIQKNYTTALAFLMMLLMAILGAQTVLAAKADTLAMRSVKFAAGNMIPVVGGSVSELLRTVSAGVGYLRGNLGICGILLALFLLLPQLIRLLLHRLCWQLCASLADLLGCDGEKKLLDGAAGLCGYLIAGVSICSSVGILAMTLLVRCAGAVGG